jgi:hypothetical protein
LDNSTQPPGWRRWGGKVALVGGGLLVGGILAASLTAGAATPTTSNTANSGGAIAVGPDHRGGPVDESKSQRPDEHLLSGDTASKVWPGVDTAPVTDHSGAGSEGTRPLLCCNVTPIGEERIAHARWCPR